MNQSNQKSPSAFSAWQLTVLVMMAGMGGMYFYPENFGRSSLALLVLTVVLTLLSMAMLARTFGRSQALSFPALLREHIGDLPARVILTAAAVYFAAEISCIAVKLTHMTGFFLLEKTPSQIVLAVSLLTVCLLITSGIRQIARTAELLFLAIMLPLAFIMGMGLYSTNFGELLPLLKPNRFVIGQLPQSVMPLSGIAATAYFAGYYNKKKLARSLLGGSAALAVFCVLILLCCVGVFSVEGTRHLAFPLTELSRIVSVGNVSLNHRFDILYMMIYTSVTLITGGILLYCCSISLCGVCHIKSHSCFHFLLLPVIFAVSYFSLSDDSAIRMMASWGKVFFLFLLIPLLYIFTTVKQMRRKAA